MKKATISVVVTAYNEGERLSRCLSSVRWADEIIVVDSSSTDNTEAVARRFTKHIYKQPNFPMLNTNKNFGFAKASGDWILSLDADEVIPSDLAAEIKEAVGHADQIVGYWLPRKNMIFGKWIQHGLWWPDKQLRLFTRGKGSFPGKHVHEYVSVDGPTAELATPYVHHNYESIRQYLWKMENIYTENEVTNLVASQYHVSWYDAVRFPVSDFLKIFFAQEGYKDGLHGLVLSILQAFYSFIVFAKLWERQKFSEMDIELPVATAELTRAGRDMNYWMLTSEMKETSSPLQKLWYQILRKLSHQGA